MKSTLLFELTSLKNEGSYVSFALLVQQVSGFITVIVLARILGASDYGALALIKSILAVCVTFGPLGLNIGLLKTLTRFDQKTGMRARSFQSFRKFVFICNLLAPIGVFAAVYFWNALPLQPNVFWIALLVALISLPFAADISLFGAYYRVTDRVMLFAKTSLIWQSLMMGSMAIFAAMLFRSFIAVTAVNTLVLIAISAIFYFRFRYELKSEPNNKNTDMFKDLNFYTTIRQSMWMGCSTFFYGLLRNLDLIMLGAFVSSHQIAAYSLLSTMAYVIFVVPLALSQSLGPAVARAYELGDQGKIKHIFNSYFKTAGVISSFIAAGIAAFGDRLSLIIGDSYKLSPVVAFLLAIAQLVSAILGPTGFALSMTGHHKQEFALLVSATLSMAAMLYFVLPNFGLEGAAFVSLVVYGCTNGIRYILVKRYTGVWLARWMDLYFPLLSLGLALICRYFSHNFGDGLIVSILACVGYALVFFCCYFFSSELGAQTSKQSSK